MDRWNYNMHHFSVWFTLNNKSFSYTQTNKPPAITGTFKMQQKNTCPRTKKKRKLHHHLIILVDRSFHFVKNHITSHQSHGPFTCRVLKCKFHVCHFVSPKWKKKSSEHHKQVTGHVTRNNQSTFHNNINRGTAMA